MMAAIHSETRGDSDTPPPDFESCGGVLRDLDDGHVPETHSSAGQWVDYEQRLYSPQNNPVDDNEPHCVHVFDDAVSTSLVDALYETTVEEGKPWGTYVTMDQVAQYRSKAQPVQGGVHKDDVVDSTLELQHLLSIQAVSQFLSLMSQPTKYKDPPEPHYYCVPAEEDVKHTPTCRSQTLLHDDDADDKAIHGVAVWALASDAGSRVPYHVDYAEYIRYRYNVLVPPLWAGTLQCSPYVKSGGEFAVQRQGWTHYEQYGYKACRWNTSIKQPDADMGGWRLPTRDRTTSNENAAVPHWDRDTDWITVPYRYNRCIGHAGTLPHVSGTFELVDTDKKRVIVGFNVFGHDVGHHVQRVPEHSQEFRRRIAAQRPRSKTTTRLSLESIRSHPKLATWLVLAKREKIKRDFSMAQQTLDGDLTRLLELQGTVRVETVTTRLGRTDGMWPSPQDVHVHLQRRLRQGAIATRSETPMGSRLALDDTIVSTLLF